MNLLVTGGAGYIGSHTVQKLLRDGHRVVVIDNLFRGHREAMVLLEADRGEALTFVEGDITSANDLSRAFDVAPVDAVMHFAALAYVGESVEMPLRYFDANITGLARILECCQNRGVGRLVFSSSCSTYGNPPEGMIPVPEACPQSPVSPYGRTKLIGEWMIRDYAQAQHRAGRRFDYTFLRYFNVCGCDVTEVLGEDHTPESHLVPILMQVALGQRQHVDVFGTDYPTPDGTCVRDYVHVDDLAEAHLLALHRSSGPVGTGEQRPEDHAYNVGIGRGYSVKQVIEAARNITGHPIPVGEGPRRAGDAAMLFNNPASVERDLCWKARHTTIEVMIETAWRWFKTHPHGY